MSRAQEGGALGRATRRCNSGSPAPRPRVPSRGTSRAGSGARARDKKQTGGRGRFGDGRIVLTAAKVFGAQVLPEPGK